LVNRIFNQHFVGQVVALFGLLNTELLNLVKQLQDLFVRAPILVLVVFAPAFAIQEGQGAKQGGRQELPPAFLAVQVNVKQIAGVKLGFVP